MTGKNLLGLAFRTTGLAFVVVAGVTAVSTLLFVLGAHTVTGVVTDNSTIRNQIAPMPGDAETGVLYYPVISYTLTDGTVRTFTGPRGRSQPEFAVGDEVSILVAENDSGRARLDTILGVWGTPLILGGLAAIFLLIGLAAPFGFGGSKRNDSHT